MILDRVAMIALGALLGVAPSVLWVPPEEDRRSGPLGRPDRPLEAEDVKEACLAVREELGLDKDAFWRPAESPLDTGVDGWHRYTTSFTAQQRTR